MTEHEMNYATDLASLVSSKVNIDNVSEHINYLKNKLNLDPKGFIMVCAHATYIINKDNDTRNTERLIAAFGAFYPSSTSEKIAADASLSCPDKKSLELMIISSITSSKTLHEAVTNVINSIRLSSNITSKKMIILTVQNLLSRESVDFLL